MQRNPTDFLHKKLLSDFFVSEILLFKYPSLIWTWINLNIHSMTERNNMISIIIPTYNEARYIKRTLQQFNALKDRKNFEVIVSDGCSTDNTVMVAEKYADKVIVSKKKLTIAAGRDNGVKIAKGDILIFLDADIQVPSVNIFFRKVKEIFKNPRIVAATTKVYIRPAEATLFDKTFHFLFSHLYFFLNFLHYGVARGECQIIRKDVFLKIKGYDKRLVAGEDFDLFYRLGKVGKIHYFRDLVVYESRRRYERMGYPKVLALWFMNYMSVIFFKRSYSKEWEPAR